MRCPKCHYISFDSGDRCRNCGYDFSLSVDAGADAARLDLPIQSDAAPVGPLGDFDLGRAASTKDVPPAGAAGDDASPARPMKAPDLPLFTDRSRTDPAPVASPAPAPRAPLAVRKSNPPPRGRSRAADDEPTLDLGAIDSFARPRARAHAAATPEAESIPVDEGAAGILARLMAGLIDTGIMIGVHAAVIYFTLRLCGLTFDEIAALPPVPMVGFLLLLTGGYFVSFTAAGGQTIGKMAAGIRVVPSADTDEGPARVPFGNAVLRAAACLLSVLPAGAGLLLALFSAERRALHDRLADTRVVKA